jgi:hypothetical protein
MAKVKGERAAAFLRAGSPALNFVFDFVAQKAPVHLAMEHPANGALREEFPGAAPLRNFGKKEIHHVGRFFGAGLFEERGGLGGIDGEGLFGKHGNAARDGAGEDLVLAAGHHGNGEGVGAALLEHGAPVVENGHGGFLTVVEQTFTAPAAEAHDGAGGDLLEGGQDAVQTKAGSHNGHARFCQGGHI